MKADVNLTVRQDDQVDGQIVMAVDRSFIPPGDGSQAALVSALSSGVFAGTPAGAHQETYADPRYVGTLVTIHGMTLLDFDRATAASGLKIVHSGGRFRLTGTVDTAALAPGPTASDADARRMQDSFDVLVRVTFPGRVVSSNGTVDGDTVTWRPSLGQRIELRAEAEDSAGGFTWLWLLAGVLAVGAVAVVDRRRRGRWLWSDLAAALRRPA
ncbi:MAG TPA: hypothetical protein VKF59_02955 [Candidatus Dormibacteraeota bacterium]|nr:hypothetical protein [Candidatus Dormibacteraeota bacterium]